MVVDVIMLHFVAKRAASVGSKYWEEAPPPLKADSVIRNGAIGLAAWIWVIHSWRSFGGVVGGLPGLQVGLEPGMPGVSIVGAKLGPEGVITIVPLVSVPDVSGLVVKLLFTERVSNA
jgi:hypothetical protein